MISRLPKGQSWIVNLMKGRMQSTAVNAACEGIVTTFAMLILTSPQSAREAITSLNHLLTLMSAYQPNELKDQIEKTYYKYQMLFQEEKRKALCELSGKDLTQIELDEFYHQLSRSDTENILLKIRENIKNTFTPEDNHYLKIDAILQSIAVFFKPYDFPFLFAQKNDLTYVQDISLSAPILVPNIKEVEQVMSQPSCFLSKAEFAQSLNVLEDIVHKNKYNQPIIIFIRSSTHTVAFGLSKMDNIFFIIDAAGLPIDMFSAKRFQGKTLPSEKIAHNIYCAFGLTKDEPMIVNMDIYALTKSEAFSLALITKTWMREPSIKSIFTLPQERAAIIDEKNDNLLMITVVNNQIKFVTTLLANENFDPNRKGRKNIFPLIYAAQKNYIEIVKALLAHSSIDPNQLYENAYNTLHASILLKNVEIAKLLIAHPAIDLSIKNQVGKTPLELARQTNQQDLIELIENKLNTKIEMTLKSA
ncbi:MAG: ankyrin repeat domain-containing protein [Gammaproteobacteria bacterium]|nr:ankyrin repeat domain-containing protein [Gammaproteobacteria bacterium]